MGFMATYYTVFYHTILSITFIADLSVILIILCHKDLRSQRLNVFMLSLTFANLLVAIAFSFSKVFKDEEEVSNATCSFLKGIIVLATSTKMYSFLCTSYETWMILTNQYSSPHYRTPWTVVLFVTWLAGFIQAIPVWSNFKDINNIQVEMCTFRAMQTDWQIFAFTTIFVIPTVLLIILNGVVWKHVYRSEYLNNEVKGLIILSVLCFMFMMFWWPAVVYVGATKHTWDTKKVRLGDTFAVDWSLANSLMSPLLYIMLNDSARERAKTSLLNLVRLRFLSRTGYTQVEDVSNPE